MLTVNEAIEVLESTEKFVEQIHSEEAPALEEQADTAAELAAKIIDVERTLVETGIEDESEEMDTEQEMTQWLMTEGYKVVKWLEEECSKLEDWQRIQEDKNNKEADRRKKEDEREHNEKGKK